MPSQYCVDVMSLPLRGPGPGAAQHTAVSVQALFDTPAAPPPPSMHASAPPPPPPPPTRREAADACNDATIDDSPWWDAEDADDEDEFDEEVHAESGESLLQVFLSDDHQDVLWSLLADADADETHANFFLDDLHAFAGAHAIFRVGGGGSRSSVAGGTPFSWEALEIADLCFLSERYGKKKHARLPPALPSSPP